MNKALTAANDYSYLSVPLEVRNAPTELMKNLGYGKNYKWEADFIPQNGFLPNEIKDINFF